VTADELRKKNQATYIKKAKQSMMVHVKAMVEMMRMGAVAFEYGNNLRQQALDTGYKDAFAFPGFVQRYIRPMFCEGRGPFRWNSLIDSKDDIYTLDDVVLKEFSYNKELCRWIEKAKEKVKFQGLPARVCWLGFGERAKFGKIINDMVSDILIFTEGNKFIALRDCIASEGIEYHLPRIFLTATMIRPYRCRISDSSRDFPITGDPSRMSISSILSSRLCRLVVISMKSSIAGREIAIAILMPPRT
jgi:hypothetical protein